MKKEEKYGIIYLIRNKKNEKIYIGQTTSKRGFDGRYNYGGEPIEKVYKRHIRNKQNGTYYNKHLLCAIEKYGFQNFEVIKELISGDNIEELNILEELCIALFDSTDPEKGYNNKPGGNNSKDTELVKCRKSEAMKGKKNPFYGKHHSDETKIHLSEIRKNKPMTKETRNKIKDKNRRGDHPQAIKIKCKNTGQVFNCINDAAEFYKIDNSSILKVCKGKRHYCGKLPNGEKLEWEFV